MIVLAIKTIEGTGMVENGKISVPILRPIGDGVSGIAAAGSGGTDKIGDTIGGQGIMVVIQVPLMGTTPANRSTFHHAETTVPRPPIRNHAAMNTKGTGDAVFRTGRICRQSIGLPAVVMDLLYLRPDGIKMIPDTVCTEPYRI